MSLVKISPKGLDDALQALRDYPAKLQAAQRIIISKATRWAAQKMIQEMAEAHNIPASVLIQRRRVATRYGVVWVGFNPIPAGQAGTPVKTSTGVYVNGIHYQGAFLIRLADGSFAVYAKTEYPGIQYALRSMDSLHEVMFELNRTPAVVQRVKGMTSIYMGSIAEDTIRSLQ